ncbi:response regulator transcription factor [Sphingomonas sp. NPDC092331]|jgi:two-component system, OmpR family, response regulator|uniref:response regulator transcription factor n=1 Tax=unclassified Sphingomonas TaxID=196159 RepID=UPI0029EF9CF5|nr:response regulator transcription factor [Pseudomonadota bacterium]
MRLLLIEDDIAIADYIGACLSGAGHEVRHVPEGQAGLVEAKNGHFDLLIVDRVLPDGDGVFIVDGLRKSGFTNPVLMLTALGSIEDRVEGLRHGADDYLVKPFAQAELLARIDALFRRSKGAFQDVYEHASITINRRRREAWRAGQRILLQPREFELLEQLVLHEGRYVSKAMMLENVWNFHFHPDTNIVETHMSRLRQKLNTGFATDAIQTARRVGYRLRDDC